MAWSFNPFTGNLDLTGSSGAVVFEGEVETFADLPEVVGDPPVGSSYLVRTSTGVWLVNRKQAGIWIRSNNTGVRDTDWAYGGDYPVNSVAGKTGNVSLNKSDVGLGNVDNTSDANKPISAATQTALDGKAASVHTHTASQISDSTSTGRSVLTAADAAAARSAISAQVAGSYAAASHAHAASDVTSGTFDNARVNFAAPAAIGSTSPAAGSFTNLSASAELQLPTNAPASPSAGDIYRNANTLRYRDSSNTERLLLNATDNLANLASASTARTNIGVGSSDAVTFGSIQGTPIGSTTAAAITGTTGTFSTLNANNGTLTASAPALTVSQTWNNSGVTFSALDINVTNTASFGNSALIKATIGGTTVFQFRTDYRLLLSPSGSDAIIQAGGVDWIGGRYNGTTSIAAPTIRFNTGNSTILEVGTADTMEMRRTTNPQTFRLYNTFTDASNYERGFMRWSSNVLQIGTEKGGTGSARALEFQTDGITRVTISSGVGNIIATNAFLAGTDCGGFNGLGLVVASNRFVAWTDGSTNSSTRDMCMFRSGAGILLLQSNTTDFNRIQFGGTTSSFPALKRSSTALQVRLADDSAFAPLSCGALTLNGNLDASTRNIVTDTTTGTRIGTGTTQLLGFWNAAPSAQPAAVADATDAATVITQLNTLLSRLRTIGIIAT